MNTIQEKISFFLNEKSFIGNGTEDRFYAVKIDGVPEDYGQMSFGRQIGYRKQIEEFKKTSKKDVIYTKGKKSYIKPVKDWIKDNKPNEYLCICKAPSSMYYDDSIDIYYK